MCSVENAEGRWLVMIGEMHDEIFLIVPLRLIGSAAMFSYLLELLCVKFSISGHCYVHDVQECRKNMSAPPTDDPELLEDYYEERGSFDPHLIPSYSLSGFWPGVNCGGDIWIHPYLFDNEEWRNRIRMFLDIQEPLDSIPFSTTPRLDDLD